MGVRRGAGTSRRDHDQCAGCREPPRLRTSCRAGRAVGCLAFPCRRYRLHAALAGRRFAAGARCDARGLFAEEAVIEVSTAQTHFERSRSACLHRHHRARAADLAVGSGPGCHRGGDSKRPHAVELGTIIGRRARRRGDHRSQRTAPDAAVVDCGARARAGRGISLAERVVLAWRRRCRPGGARCLGRTRSTTSRMPVPAGAAAAPLGDLCRPVEHRNGCERRSPI